MEFWPILFDIGALLGVAFALGALCERLRQSALLGYLLAGMLLGPNAFHVVQSSSEVEGLAEVGVCLLLFSLGLEFSWRRLRALGLTALGGGALQVGLTLLTVTLLGLLVGLRFRTALVVGAAFALSSTAGVLRVIMARSEIDSIHGRHALGILLFQDLAVIPLVLLASFLDTPASDASALWSLGRTGLLLICMVLGFYVIFNFVVPRIFLVTSALRNRELPVLLAVVGALGSIYVAHELGLSPAVGAFIAGILLGECPFATQVRADLSVLRTLLVTLFFSSVGMLADPVWIVENIGLVVAVTVAIVILKTLITTLALRAVRQTAVSSLTAGICLAQIGEFAFVIAETARESLIDEDIFMVIVSAMMVTLCLTPFLIAGAPTIAVWALKPLSRLGLVKTESHLEGEVSSPSGHIVLIGYGPAGECCGERLRAAALEVSVLDLNPSLAVKAKGAGFGAHVGDATYPEVLEHMNVGSAAAVVVTLPDPRSAEQVVHAVRCATTHAPVIVRSRFHKYRDLLEPAGRSAVVDEEEEVGSLLGRRTLALLKPRSGLPEDMRVSDRHREEHQDGS